MINQVSTSRDLNVTVWPRTFPVAVRGCYPADQPLPLLGPAAPLVSPVCELQETDLVSACLCHTPECNAPVRARARRPKQIVFPSEAPRLSRETGLKCFSCGSLFNKSSPACDKVRSSLGQRDKWRPSLSSTPTTTDRLPAVLQARPVSSTPGRSPAQRLDPTGNVSPPPSSWATPACQSTLSPPAASAGPRRTPGRPSEPASALRTSAT